jgi:hypothetical protein
MWLVQVELPWAGFGFEVTNVTFSEIPTSLPPPAANNTPNGHRVPPSCDRGCFQIRLTCPIVLAACSVDVPSFAPEPVPSKASD